MKKLFAFVLLGILGSAGISGAQNSVLFIDAVFQPLASGFDTAFCNSVGYIIARTTGGWACANNIPINLNWLGAKGDNSTDNATVIQNAINNLPAAGNTLTLDGGIYCIKRALTAGNGTTSTVSTRSGISFRGLGAPIEQGTVPVTQQTTIKWCGSSTSNSMLTFNGPMVGGGVENINFNCNSLAGEAVRYIGISFNSNKHVVVQSCTGAGMHVISRNSFLAKNEMASQENYWLGININVPPVSGAKGLWFDGNGTNGSSNSSLNTVTNLSIELATSSTTMYGLYLSDTDSNLFNSVFIIGGGASSVGVALDYSGAAGGQWPANNTFVQYAPALNAGGAAQANIGTPAPSARPNRFFGISDTNGITAPKMANANYMPEIVGPGLNFTGQTTTIANTPISGQPLYLTGMYEICGYLEVTTAGDGGATLAVTASYTDDSGSVFSGTVSSSIPTSSVPQGLGQCIPFRAKSGTNVSVGVNVKGSMGTAVYAFHAKLLKLD